ncbi:MAG: extracellular solute-binding protein [Phycisphaera sp.]|nr:extracellular solute-binding protein [Phycisphaera sp.]
MSDKWIKIVVVLLLALIVGVPLAMRHSDASNATDSAPGDRLVIITPHNEQIRFEFARAFNEYRVSKGQGPVAFDWRALGGTSDLRKMVLAAYEAEAKRAHEDHRPVHGVGFDLFFGGGEYEHNVLARGIDLAKVTGEKGNLSVTVPIDMPESLLYSAFPEPDIGGARLYHPEFRWVGAALSSFGIVYNRDLLAMLKLPEPTTWSDLTSPDYLNQVALSDPGHSGSIGATYEAILRREGWTDGWKMLRRVFANSRYFTASSAKVPVDISSGEAAAGMCIDFYGRYQSGAIVNPGGGEPRVGYVDPKYMTSVNADPISILLGAPHEKIAHEFVLWLLTPEAQGLWQKRLGVDGGPVKFELRRLPVRQDMYSPRYMKEWTDQVNPWDYAKAFPDGMPYYYAMVTPVSHALGIDVHDGLVAAWEAILNTKDPRKKEELLALFDAMPDELTLPPPPGWVSAADALRNDNHPMHQKAVEAEAAFEKSLSVRYSRYKDADKLTTDRVRWSIFFAEQYREVVRRASE